MSRWAHVLRNTVIALGYALRTLPWLALRVPLLRDRPFRRSLYPQAAAQVGVLRAALAEGRLRCGDPAATLREFTRSLSPDTHPRLERAVPDPKTANSPAPYGRMDRCTGPAGAKTGSRTRRTIGWCSGGPGRRAEGSTGRRRARVESAAWSCARSPWPSSKPTRSRASCVPHPRT